MSEKAMLSHEAGTRSILNFTIVIVMVIGRGLFLSLFGEIHMRQGGEMIYNLFPKFHVKHWGFLFYGPRKSEEGADTDLIYYFCWPRQMKAAR